MNGVAQQGLVRFAMATKVTALPVKGAKVVGSRSELADVDVLFTMVNTGKDLKEICFGADGMFRDGVKSHPKMLVDCSTIGVDESAAIRKRLGALGADYIAAPVSGNARVIVAGKLSAVASGPEVDQVFTNSKLGERTHGRKSTKTPNFL